MISAKFHAIWSTFSFYLQNMAKSKPRIRHAVNSPINVESSVQKRSKSICWEISVEVMNCFGDYVLYMRVGIRVRICSWLSLWSCSTDKARVTGCTACWAQLTTSTGRTCSGACTSLRFLCERCVSTPGRILVDSAKWVIWSLRCAR